jgi:hypothetical protein
LDSQRLTKEQREVVEKPIAGKIFLDGPSGSGKTTTGVARTRFMIRKGIPAHSIMILLPHRALGAPYRQISGRLGLPAGSRTTILTLGGLARRMVDLFWPYVAQKVGFAQPEQEPIFLTLETAQYIMAEVVDPLLEAGFFETVTIHPNRLYSQVIDNLNKAAVVGFPYTEIGERLKRAWIGDPSQLKVYEDAQHAASLFRERCVEAGLLDFSLQLEVFRDHIWPESFFRDFIDARYLHLVFDNLEEDTPISHDFVRDWLPRLESALLIYDSDAGVRRFLGADPDHAYTLHEVCGDRVTFMRSFVASPEIERFAARMTRAIQGDRLRKADRISPAVRFETRRYHPQMLDWVVEEVERLIHDEGVQQREITILAPFLSDQLRFSLEMRFQPRGISTWSKRPSRALREEQTVRTLLTIAALCHPSWGVFPTVHDVIRTLLSALEGMDLVRAHLLAQILYRPKDGKPCLHSFKQIHPEMQDRITFSLGEKYERMREWIEAEAAKKGALGHPKRDQPFDVFLARLFGEVLSQPGFGFHHDFDAGAASERLITSVRKFRRTLGGQVEREDKTVGEVYARLAREGILAAQYPFEWEEAPEEAVLMVPAYTFLMADRSAQVQFWLDVGSPGWWERLYQPLTHPYVLSRQWPREKQWSDSDELHARNQALQTLVIGLLRRCRSRVYLAMSELDEQGDEQRGPLLRALNQTLRMRSRGGGS